VRRQGLEPRTRGLRVRCGQSYVVLSGVGRVRLMLVRPDSCDKPVPVGAA